MSTSALPAPIAANISSAAAAWGAPPTTLSGMPHSATPTPMQRAWRPVQEIVDAISEPATAPSPIPALRTPTWASSPPRRSDRYDDHEHGDAAAQHRLHEA